MNLPVRIQLSSRSPDLSLERVNAIQDGAKSIKKARISGLLCHSGAAAPLRIFFVSSPSGRCPTETANFLLLLVLSWHYPIMIGGAGGS